MHIDVHRIVAWPDLRCAGEAEVHGAPMPDPPAPQDPPKNGTGPRVDCVRAGRALMKLPHQLLTFRGGDGHPVVAPVRVRDADGGAITLEAAAGLLPAGGRRASPSATTRLSPRTSAS